MKPHWYRTLNADTRRAFWTTFAGFSLDSFAIQLYAFVLPALLLFWGLDHTQAGLLATAALISSAAGGWIAGLLADRFGRVRMLNITVVWLAIATCLCGLADNFERLLAARILQGLGFGAEIAVGAVFIGEMAPALVRGRVSGTAQSGWAVGWGAAAAISALILSVVPAEFGWRVTFLIGLVPALLVFALRRRLHEPETFLKSSRQSSWHAIFSAPNLSSTVKGSLLAAGMHGGYWAIATWWPVMLRAERGLSAIDSSPYLAALIIGSFFGYLVASWLSDALGRKIALTCFSLSGIVIALAYNQFPASATLLLALSVPLGFVATGMIGLVGPILTELYPTELRGSGLGFCYNFGRGMAGTTPALIGISAERLGVGHAIGLYVACAYTLVLFSALLLPETRGRELQNLSETSSRHS